MLFCFNLRQTFIHLVFCYFLQPEFILLLLKKPLQFWSFLLEALDAAWGQKSISWWHICSRTPCIVQIYFYHSRTESESFFPSKCFRSYSIVPCNLLNAIFPQSQKSHYERTWCRFLLNDVVVKKKNFFTWLSLSLKRCVKKCPNLTFKNVWPHV